MGKRDMRANVDAVQHVVPQVASASITPNVYVDVRDHDEIMAVVQWGAIAGAGDFGAVLMEGDAADGSGATAVAAADRNGSFLATALQNTVERVSYKGTKRYVGVNVVKAGGTSIAVAVSFVRGRPHTAPLA